MTAPKINVLDMFHGDNREALPDFRTLKNFGVHATIHKASQGIHYADPKYKARRAVCQDAGMLWGAYHFLDSSPAADQADFFLNSCGASNGDPILLAADYETSNQPPSLLQLMEFLKIVDAATPSRCVIYSGNLIRETLRPPGGGFRSPQMVGSEQFFQTHRLWLAEYGPHERIPFPWCEKISEEIPAPGVFLWQFTDRAHVNPIIGNVDGNFFDGDFAALAKGWAA